MGGITGKGYAIQGNILKSAKVVPAIEKTFLKTKGNLPTRLHAALLAGDRAGGGEGQQGGRGQAAALGVRDDQPDSDSAYGLSRLRRSGAKPC